MSYRYFALLPLFSVRLRWPLILVLNLHKSSSIDAFVMDAMRVHRRPDSLLFITHTLVEITATKTSPV